MKLVLFDLGDTLEHADVLRPGALEVLTAVHALNTGPQPVVRTGLLSDFTMPGDPAEIPALTEEYYAIITGLGIRPFFEPVERFVTLSTQVGVFKPAEELFRTAVARADPALAPGDVLFVTENRAHVRAARRLGLGAVQVSPPGRADGEVQHLVDLLPLVRALIAAGTQDATETVP